MLPVRRQVVIQLGDVPVLLRVSGRPETVSRGIKPVAHSEIVGQRITRHVLRNNGIGARLRSKAVTVHRGNLRRSKGHVSCRRRVGDAVDRHRSARALACVAIQAVVLDDAIAERRCRDGALRTDGFGITIAFEVQEEVKTVFEDRASDGGAENIAVELRRLVRQSAIDLRRLDEVIVGAEIRVAVVFVDGAVKRVRAALGDECDLSRG